MRATVLVWLALLIPGGAAGAADYPPPAEGDCVLKDFHFASGETLPEVRMHYRTIGRPERGGDGKVRNAVLILHGTTGSSGQFVGKGRPDDWFAGELFGPGQPLDGRRYYIVIPDNIGHGKSTKPSDGMHARFPRYGYHDMIAAQYRLLTECLGVDHLRLVLGTSMGGMHCWLWGELHPDFVDALMPLASLPTQISGRNRLWRKMVIDAIRTDPSWEGGDYKAQPRGLRFVADMFLFMSGNPVTRYREAPTLRTADEVFGKQAGTMLRRMDANDMLYAFEASHDYDPGPALEKIRAPLLAVNSADDLINPPELGILEKEIKRVSRGRAVVLPFSDATVGHSSHTKAVLWKQYLVQLFKESER
jgi:homoserine O-acetyltransferase